MCPRGQCFLLATAGLVLSASRIVALEAAKELSRRVEARYMALSLTVTEPKVDKYSSLAAAVFYFLSTYSSELN